MDGLEHGQQQSAAVIQNDQNDDQSTTSLLKQILSEIKKFNEERESVKTELHELKMNNNLLLDTISQQQRFLEEIDADRRAKNLIVLGVPEADITMDDQTAKTDMEKIDLVLNKIGYNGSNAVSVQRLGRQEAGSTKRRPIKVVLSNTENRQRVLSLAKDHEQDLPGALSGIKLKRDVHPAIRKEYGRMFEAERKEKAKPENTGKNIFFDKARRVLLVDGEVIDRFKPSFF